MFKYLVHIIFRFFQENIQRVYTHFNWPPSFSTIIPDILTKEKQKLRFHWEKYMQYICTKGKVSKAFLNTDLKQVTKTFLICFEFISTNLNIYIHTYIHTYIYIYIKHKLAYTNSIGLTSPTAKKKKKWEVTSKCSREEFNWEAE